MIAFDAKTNLFHLRGASYSYVMFVNEWGYLQCLHYGGRVGGDNLTYLKQIDFKSFSPTPPDILIEGVSLDLIPSEYASFGQSDFRAPSAVIEQADGARMSRFRYCSHEIEEGAPDWGALPHARAEKGGAQTLSVRLKDAVSGMEIVLHYTVFEHSDVLVRNAEFYNGTNGKLYLNKAFSFCFDLPADDYSLLRLAGRHQLERMPEYTPLAHGTIRLSSERGASSHQMNPFMGLLKKDCTEHGGECYGAALCYSGSFALTAEVSQSDTVRVQGGICEEGFRWSLSAGERFVTPQAFLAYSDRGLGGMSRAYADFYRERVISPAFAYKRRPIVVNNWEATYFDFDVEKLNAIVDEGAKIGIDTFVLDDGWFGIRNDPTSGLGDWSVNEEKLKGGLNAVISHCKEKGMQFGLWFEPEMISKNSELFRSHPDWAVGKVSAGYCESRHQLVLDFSRPEIVEAIYKQVSDILSAYDISYVKWDMNRHITEQFSAALPADRQGEFAHRFIMGVYTLADRLTRAFPNVLFEGCSGGGGRFDAGMLYYFPQIWTSDNTDGYDRVKIQYGTSIAYPLSAMSCHVSVCPNHQTKRTVSLKTRGDVASLGATGYELDLSKLRAEEKEEMRLQIKAYRRVSRLILEGDLYRLSDPFHSNYFCMQVVAKDRSEAYLVGEEILTNSDDNLRRIRLQGLDGAADYTVEELGITLKGDTLMRAGCILPHLSDFGTWVWHIRKV